MSEASQPTMKPCVDRSRKLTPEQVATVRRSSESDGHFARLWGVAVLTIRACRIGRTHKQHPVPPQTVKRSPGRYRSAA